jgi:hypothetical protein
MPLAEDQHPVSDLATRFPNPNCVSVPNTDYGLGRFATAVSSARAPGRRRDDLSAPAVAYYTWATFLPPTPP